jgi:hypothetical protein
VSDAGRCAYCEGRLDRANHYQCGEALRKEAFLVEYPHKCPKCLGGKVAAGTKVVKRDRLMTDEERGFADIRHGNPIMIAEEVPVTNLIMCDLCDGFGRLQKEPKAIMGVVRWEKQ